MFLSFGVGLSGLVGAFVVGGRLWVGGGQRRKRLGVYGNAMREVKEGWTVGFRGRRVVFRGGRGWDNGDELGGVGRLKSDSEVEVVLGKGGQRE